MHSTRANHFVPLLDLPCLTINMTDFDCIVPTPKTLIGARDCLDLRGTKRKRPQQSDGYLRPLWSHHWRNGTLLTAQHFTIPGQKNKKRPQGARY